MKFFIKQTEKRNNLLERKLLIGRKLFIGYSDLPPAAYIRGVKSWLQGSPVDNLCLLGFGLQLIGEVPLTDSDKIKYNVCWNLKIKDASKVQYLRPPGHFVLPDGHIGTPGHRAHL